MANKMKQWVNNNYASERGLIRLCLAHLESLIGRTREFEHVEFSNVERLVFVCLGNICRSPFAEHVARQQGVPTAGFGLSTTTGRPAYELGMKSAQVFDIDMSTHVTTDIGDFEILETDLLLVMEVRHARQLRKIIGASRAQIALLGHWAKPRRLHIHDPHAHDHKYFEHCYRVIEQATLNLVREYKLARSSTEQLSQQ